MKLLVGSTLAEILHDSFQAHASRVAIEYGEVQYRYDDIEALGWRYYDYYRDAGLQRGDHIGILADVSPYAIGAMLGALYAGIIYIPINIFAPAQWIASLADSAQLKNILVQRRYQDRVVMPEREDICIDCLDSIVQQQGAGVRARQYARRLSDDIAYILYTSGSTGAPKGIMLTHRNACAFVVWMKNEFALRPDDRIFSRAPLQFDLSVFDIFTTFLSGACLVIVPQDFINTPENVVSYMRDRCVTVVYTVPSAYIRWLNKGELTRNIPSLRLMLYAGEPFAASWLRKVMQCLPQSKVANIYGPTETNIVTCHHLTACPEETDNIPIGYPVADTDIYIVDEQLNLLPPGEMGEILVRGSTVFAGYFNDTALTGQKLIRSPFHGYPTLLCRTGDYGCRDADGVLRYFGRMDNMVKTRGYRVEPGEVENLFAAIQGVMEAAIIPLADAKYGATLHACLVLADDARALPGVQQRFRELAPSYMYPASFTLLSELPKTVTGKIDRVTLRHDLTHKPACTDAVCREET